MEHKNIEEIAIVYGKKELVEEFLEIFHMDIAKDYLLFNSFAY